MDNMEDKKQSETEKPPCANHFARPQGEGWLPLAEAENAVNVALRLSGGAVSACLPMYANRGRNTKRPAFSFRISAFTGTIPCLNPFGRKSTATVQNS